MRFFLLRKAKSVYYPPAIRASGPANSKIDTALEVAVVGKANPVEALTSFNNPSKVAEQPRSIEKEVNATQGVAPGAIKPPTTSQDLPAKKEVPTRMEIVLTTLPMFGKGDLASKGLEASEAASIQPIKAPPKEKIVIKRNSFQCSSLFFLKLFSLFSNFVTKLTFSN